MSQPGLELQELDQGGLKETGLEGAGGLKETGLEGAGDRLRRRVKDRLQEKTPGRASRRRSVRTSIMASL